MGEAYTGKTASDDDGVDFSDVDGHGGKIASIDSVGMRPEP